MSIVTDALNRLQAERAPLSRNSETSTGAEPSSSSDSPKPEILSPQTPVHTIRNILRVSLIIVALGGVGIGTYLWGLNLIPDVARVSPEHDRRPEPIPQVNPVEPAASQVVEAIPEPTPEKESSETGTPVSEDSTGNSDPTETVDTQKASPQHMASSEVLPPAKVSDKPVVPLAQPETKTPAKENLQVAKVAPPDLSPSLTESSNGSQPSVAKLQAESPQRPETMLPPIPRNATPLEAKIVQAKYLIKKRRYGQAVTVLQPLFVKPPETWEPWFWLGTAKLGLGQWKGAEDSFVEGLARNATVPQLWVQRALVSQQQGKFGEALEALRQAELIAPQLPEVQLNLAYSLEVQGHIESAVDHYHTFLALTEGNPAYHPARRKVLERVIRLEKT